MSLTLVMMIAGAGLKAAGSLIAAGRQNEAINKQSAFAQSQFDNNMARMDIADRNLGLQRQQAGIQLDSDLNQMNRQRTQQIGGMNAMAAASGIVTNQSSMGAEIQDQDDQFLRGIGDRQKFGELQMQGFDNQQADMHLQRQGMRQALSHGQDMAKFEKTNNWINAGFNAASSVVDMVGSGEGNNWWRTPAKKG
jgi:hypothetical protein